MYRDRRDLYVALEAARGSKVITYATGDRRGLEAQIGQDALDPFVHHLDRLPKTKKISLVLYTRGGDTLAAWSIANLIRQFCDEFEVIIPFKAHSAGTLISLAADKIVMTKQATLGPVDPSVTGPLNPQIPGAPPGTTAPVSVEAIQGYADFANEMLGKGSSHEAALSLLAGVVHPLVLGNAYRARGQIRRLAKKLLGNHQRESTNIENILRFLCSESGSHDYTIDRDEARSDLGLPVEIPTDELYALISSIYSDFAAELELTEPFDPRVVVGSNAAAQYSLTRCLIESVDGGQHSFVTEGTLTKAQIVLQPGAPPQTLVNDERRFEGWRYTDGAGN